VDWRLTVFALLVVGIFVAVAVAKERRRTAKGLRGKKDILNLLAKVEMSLYQLHDRLSDKYSEDDLSQYLMQLCATRLTDKREAVVIPRTLPRIFFITERGRKNAIGNVSDS
jgi:hypothetical protein